MNTKTSKGLAVLTLLAAATGTTVVEAQQPAPVSDAEARAVASEAYIYGYPLVTMYITERVQTNVVAPQPNARAPVNQVGSLFQFPTAEFRDVTAPNVNTLYSVSWLDLSREPIVVHLPDTGGRYYVGEILDYWTNVIGAPGKRTTGTHAQDVAIVGPNWQDQLPPGITSSYRSQTNGAWFIARIQTDGPKDYPEVNAIQRQITTTPLRAYGQPYTPPPGTVDPTIDVHTPPRTQVNRLPADSFFTILAHMMVANPPAPADAHVVHQMAKIGIVPGNFDSHGLNGANSGALEAGARAGLQQIEAETKTMGRIRNGWQTLVECGAYGTDYLTRAAVTMLGLGCNLVEDAIYPTTDVDAQGMKLTGSKRYVLRFLRGQTPPARAFWSVTMYDSEYFLVRNPIDRSAISSWMDLNRNADGSLDIYIQHDSPGAQREANWLPAPSGDFVLMLRLYWPEPQAIDGTWSPPGVQVAR